LEIDVLAERNTQLQSYQDTYQSIQNTTETPRQTEYRLFAQVTRSLIQSEGKDFKARAKALNWNRRLWMTLQADCAKDDNALSEEVRAGIISLAIWVEKHSRMAAREEADITALVEVNRIIMEGLATAP
jgi:flagellar protein FlaF